MQYIPEKPQVHRWVAGLASGAALALLAACGGGGTSSTLSYQLTASIDANTASALAGQEVRLSPNVALTGTVPTGATVTQVRWDFGDGSPVISISNAASFTVPQFKAYANTGSFIITLGATASTGESGSVTRSISVTSFAPTGVLANSNAVDNIGNYTRLGADGQPLAIQTATWADNGTNAAGTRWECIQDNQSKLIWEVKTKHEPSALRHYTASYAWFDDNTATNGGNAGVDNGGVCNGVADPTKCNTKAYTTAVNALPAGQALCGFRNWRMPNLDELHSIVLTTASNPAILATHFPDVFLGPDEGATWSASTPVESPEFAWVIVFLGGDDNGFVSKGFGLAARLVRSGQ
jgi:hypothetical protein